MTSKSVEVAIIGGGIGGLATAVALNRAGIDAHVYEQAEAYGDIGGHLTIDEAAIEVLAGWGLEDNFRAIACQLEGMRIKTLDSGDEILSMPVPDLGSMGVNDDGRMGTRIISSFLRTDFLDVLLSQIPSEKTHTGHRLASLEEAADAPSAAFANGNSVSCQILLAADGVRSLARKRFDDVEPVLAGHTILRSLCSIDVVSDAAARERMLFWDGWAFGDKAAGVGVHVLTVPVRGAKFLSVDLQLQGGDQLGDCNPADVPVERVMKRYPDMLDPDVQRMIDERLEPLAAYPLYDRPVASKWVDGQIAILGDAAHSMRPNLGQGACQSLHDALQLANSFAEHGLTHEALKHYEAIRLPYTQSIVETAKKTVVDPKAWKAKAEG